MAPRARPRLGEGLGHLLGGGTIGGEVVLATQHVVVDAGDVWNIDVNAAGSPIAHLHIPSGDLTDPIVSQAYVRRPRTSSAIVARPTFPPREIRPL